MSLPMAETPRNDTARSAPSLVRMAWLKGKLLPRLRRDFRGHAIVVRFAAAQGLDVLAQHLIASSQWSGAWRRRVLRRMTCRRPFDGMITRALSGLHDFKTSPRRIGDNPGTVDVGQD